MNRLPNRPNSDAAAICCLPLGLLFRGRRDRRAVLRPLSGELKVRLLDLDLKQPLERTVSQALALCVERIGSVREITPALMDSLTLSDRHALVHGLLVARGNRELSATTNCTRCVRRLELTLDLGKIELPRIPDSGNVILTCSQEGRTFRKHLRLPQAVDLAQAVDEASLVGRCLACSAKAAKPWVVAAEKVFSRYDPLGHLEILGRCLDCRAQVRAEFNLATNWLARLNSESGALLEEIHLLALRYHWAENEILRLPDGRRQAYLDLCWGAPSEPDELLV